MNTNLGTSDFSINSYFGELSKIVVGQKDLLTKSFIALLSGGHVLLEGFPGLAKTLLVKTIAESVECGFSRIQFTPDLLPSDISGSYVFNPKTNDFFVRRGPIFSNFILADEINRAPAKVQSALLEAMAERQVTIGDTSYKLPSPFVVFATQNPIEQDGTYRLPEAQADRFMLKLKVDYPSPSDELKIARNNISDLQPKVRKILPIELLKQLQHQSEKIYIDEKIEKYIVDLVVATRKTSINSVSRFLRFGASPRATIALMKCARANALIQNRNYVVPDDVLFVIHDVLRHRLGLSLEAMAEGVSPEIIINEIINIINLP